MSDILYIKADNMIRVTVPEVKVADLGDIWCSNASILEQCRSLIVFQMRGCRQVISIVDVVRVIEKNCSGVTVSSLGEQDFVIEYKPLQKHSKVWEYIKFIFVWTVIFLGAAFSIITFNEDVGVTDIFADIHQMITGQERTYLTWLEAGYAVGISGGILIFYNHLSRKKEHSDPTPLDVEMRTYEKELYSTMVDNTNRSKRGEEKMKAGRNR